jgi:hypothetical protein
MPFQLKDSLGYHHLGLKEKLFFLGHELEQLDKKASMWRLQNTIEEVSARELKNIRGSHSNNLVYIFFFSLFCTSIFHRPCVPRQGYCV